MYTLSDRKVISYISAIIIGCNEFTSILENDTFGFLNIKILCPKITWKLSRINCGIPYTQRIFERSIEIYML